MQYIDVDPLTISDDWEGEENGMISWPSLYYTDMSRYISVLAPEFLMQLESEYKLGKAYRYFSCELVKETFYRNKIKSKPYDVWCILERDQRDKPETWR